MSQGGFLLELVADRIARIDHQAAALARLRQQCTVAGNRTARS